MKEIALVTGASRGIGFAVSEYLLSLGMEVVGLARDVRGLEFPALACDVADASDVNRVASQLASEGLRVKVLVNAAGVAALNLALTTPASQAERILAVNYLGTFHCCRTFARDMIRSRFGRVINFSSIAVAMGLEGESTYIASKAAVEAFSRSFAREISDFGITVNCIAPGPIRTDLLRGVTDSQIGDIISRQVIKREFTPQDVCDIVGFLVSEQAKAISGQVISVGGV